MTTSETRDDFDRPSDYDVNAAFWNSAETHTDVGVSLSPPPLTLTGEQLQRRASLRRLVAGIVAGLTALALVAGAVALVRHQRTGSSPSPAARLTLPDTRAPAPPAVAPAPLTVEASPSPVTGVGAAFDWHAFALAPVPDAAALSAWTNATTKLPHADFVQADRELQHAANKGGTGQREAAQLARAILWRGNGYPRAAHRTFAALVEHAKTPLVRDDARAALAVK
jgi:hypothetical protein